MDSLGDGPEAGAQVLMWKAGQVLPRMACSPQRDPLKLDVDQKDNAQIILTCISSFLIVTLL